ncbi:sulfurtransferase [Alkalibacillus silvisoli]|uniref:Sulfurtransferase n=1 Tax=Alkalibacillus silvisoli TaxID=392823 RepID=A0ABP3JNI1_9BACI
MIISVQQAKQMYDQKEVIFVDCRFDLQNPSIGLQNYEALHLPNAVYFHLEDDLSGSVKQTGGRHPLPNIDQFIETVKSKGISDQSIVIAYDDHHAFASRFAWMMKAIGHEEVYILNGGIKAWTDQEYPISVDATVTTPVATKQNWRYKHELVASQEYVQSQIENEQVALIDSRSYERFIGKVEPIDNKAGHIPSAKHFDWMNLFIDAEFKSTKELQSHFKSLDMYDEVIVYCGSGVTAAPNVIALWEADYNHVKLYVGSFSDWITNDDNEVITFEDE